jgi:hypothetical protein
MATATSGAGTAGATRRRTRTIASDSSPTSTVRHCAWPSRVTTSQNCWKKLPEPLSTPSSLGTWPMMMVSARPMMKPFSTGSEMKLARNPSRATPAASARMPIVMASVMVSAVNRPELPAARSPTAAADSAAVAAIGPAIKCLELPKAA